MNAPKLETLNLIISYNLLTQTPKEKLENVSARTKLVKPGDGDDRYRHNGAWGDIGLLSRRF